jgi:hypothetical protein
MKSGVKTVKRKREKQNITKYATWNLRGKAHREEEPHSILNEKPIKITVITE